MESARMDGVLRDTFRSLESPSVQPSGPWETDQERHTPLKAAHGPESAYSAPWISASHLCPGHGRKTTTTPSTSAPVSIHTVLKGVLHCSLLPAGGTAAEWQRGNRRKKTEKLGPCPEELTNEEKTHKGERGGRGRKWSGDIQGKNV